MLGVGKLKWTGMGYFQSGNYNVYKIRRNGVASILKQDVAQAVRGYNASSDQITSIRLQGKSINITVSQVYTPTAEAEDEIESFYTNMQEEIDHTHKQDMMIVIGDWNVQVRNKTESNVRKSSLGVRKEAEVWLMDFCKANLFIANTCFQQQNR